MEDQVEGFLSPAEVGRRLRASKWTVCRWLDKGKLPEVRIGRRRLVPVAAVEELIAKQLRPEEIPDNTHGRMAFARGPAPRYDYFSQPFAEEELNARAETFLAGLQAGHWPEGTFAIKRDGLKQIMRGEQVAPPAVWRYLMDGIDALLHPVEPAPEAPKDLIDAVDAWQAGKGPHPFDV